MTNTYHGEYKSVESCQKLWVSKGQADLRFPPQVAYHCSLCNRTHNFRLLKTYSVATPGQAKMIDTYFKTRNVEQNVVIAEK